MVKSLKLILIISCYVLSESGFAKSDSSATAKSKLAIGIYYSLTLDSYRYTYSVGIGEYKTDNTFGYGTRLVINIEIPVCRRFVLSTGLYYNVKKSKHEIGVSYPELDGMIAFWALQKEYRLQLLEIPLLIKYHVLYLNKMNIHLSGGLSTLILLKEQALFVDTWGKLYEETLSDRPLSYGFSANTSVGIDYHLSEKVTISFQPELIYYITTAESEERPGYQIHRPRITTVALNLRAMYKF